MDKEFSSEIYEAQAEGAREQWRLLRGKVVEGLRERGLDDERAKSDLISWIAQGEILYGDTPLGRIEFIQDQAELYQEAGMTEAAVYELEQALDIAFHEGLNEIYDSIQERINSIDPGWVDREPEV